MRQEKRLTETRNGSQLIVVIGQCCGVAIRTPSNTSDRDLMKLVIEAVVAATVGVLVSDESAEAAAAAVVVVLLAFPMIYCVELLVSFGSFGGRVSVW